MNERIVFAREPAEFLEEKDCDVVETYHFGDVGSAALVECEADHESAIADDDRVVAIEANYEIEPHIEPAHVSEERDTVATIEDVRRLHDVPADDATGADLTVVAMDSGIDPDHPVFRTLRSSRSTSRALERAMRSVTARPCWARSRDSRPARTSLRSVSSARRDGRRTTSSCAPTSGSTTTPTPTTS
jgi:hypothetical protein